MLNINGITVRLGGRLILDHATAAIPPGARVGLIGRNGAGKSTLMKVIIGQIEACDGTIDMPRKTRLGYIAQDAPSGTATPFDTVLAAMFSRTAFERASAKAPSFHDTARRDAAFYEERVAKSLSDLVFNRLYPALGKAVAKAAPAATELDDVRQATLILLYRLLFVLYAEDRGLLPVRDKRFDDYALRHARLDIGRRKDEGDAFSSVAKTIWNRFADLAEMIDLGAPSVGLPPYNGGLFNAAKTPLLKAIALGDDVMAEAIDILSFEQQAGQRRYINYRDLSVQQLGSIYERLLEFELVRDEAGVVDLRPNIFARKNSGSYYRPDDLVLLILDETLEPLIADAMAAFEAE